MKKRKIDWVNLIWKISWIVIFLAIDLVTKDFFMKYFNNDNEEISLLGGFLEFTFYLNPGAAFGSFGDSTLFLTIISGAFVIVFSIIDVLQNDKSKLNTFAFSLIISGALGNMIDRIFITKVRDFIRLSIFPFVFNIADVCICVGVFLYVLNFIIREAKNRKKEETKVE